MCISTTVVMNIQHNVNKYDNFLKVSLIKYSTINAQKFFLQIELIYAIYLTQTLKTRKIEKLSHLIFSSASPICTYIGTTKSTVCSGSSTTTYSVPISPFCIHSFTIIPPPPTLVEVGV